MLLPPMKYSADARRSVGVARVYFLNFILTFRSQVARTHSTHHQRPARLCFSSKFRSFCVRANSRAHEANSTPHASLPAAARSDALALIFYACFTTRAGSPLRAHCVCTLANSSRDAYQPIGVARCRSRAQQREARCAPRALIARAPSALALLHVVVAKVKNSIHGICQGEA